MKIRKKDSLYFGGCQDALEKMLGKTPDDINHYDFNDLDDSKKEKWMRDKEKYFVCGNTVEEKREPLKWKIEYSTDQDSQGEMIALSW